MIVRSFISISQTTIVVFWEGVGSFVIGIANTVHDVTAMRAELIPTRFHVPCIEKLLLTALTGVVVLHLNLHNTRTMRVLRLTIESDVLAKTFG